ncbi:MAG: ABC transporter ATP-binding protein, partial [Proteobacteria bacterium]|nr:ABC transporter ATP-binding protein [Pseudomonadota bacterium]
MNSDTHTNLWQLTQGQRLRYFAAILAMGATNICIFSAPLIGGFAIDVVHQQDFDLGAPYLVDLNRMFSGGETYTGYLWLSALASIFMTAIGGIFLYFRGRLAATASENICRGLRERLYGRLHNLKAHFYDTADTGDLVQRCSSDVETMRVFLAADVIEIGRAIMLLLCVMPFLISKDARLASFAVCLMPFLALGAYIFFSKVKEVFQITDESEAAMTAVLQENLTGIRVVRAFSRQAFETEKFAARNAEFRNNNNRLIRLMGYYWATSDFFAMAQIGIVLFAGAWFIQQGSLTIGDLFTIMTCVAMVIWPVRQLGRVLTDAGKAVVSLERVNEILTEDEESNDHLPEEARTAGRIQIANLNFAYKPDNLVLKDISLDIAPGETVAIVGPPGSGKSSLIRVLLRMYPYNQGSIKLDGREISQTNRHWLRQQLGVVLQDPFLYSRSIESNLIIGRPDATREQMDVACKDAAIESAIADFPQGFEAMVGERGVTLSGGQRQRLALARALLKDPPVLVLDDSL